MLVENDSLAQQGAGADPARHAAREQLGPDGRSTRTARRASASGCKLFFWRLLPLTPVLKRTRTSRRASHARRRVPARRIKGLRRFAPERTLVLARLRVRASMDHHDSDLDRPPHVLEGAATGAFAATAAPGQAQDHDHSLVPSDPALRVKALESLLVEKGLVDPAALDVLVDTYENKVGPRNGAQVVARAWVDPAFKQRLLDDGTAAIAELGFSGQQGEKLDRRGKYAVDTQRDRLHAVLVLSVAVAGLAARLVQVRRVPLAHGHGSARCVARAWARSARRRRSARLGQQRGVALPRVAGAPAGTESMSEAELAALVTRDAMIGVAAVPSHRAGGNP